jgi:hypothetical protein
MAVVVVVVALVAGGSEGVTNGEVGDSSVVLVVDGIPMVIDVE